jgi:hypothetical protein
VNAELRRADRVGLVEVTVDYERHGLAVGKVGTVEFVDSLGTIHVKRDHTGRRVGVVKEDAALIRMAAPADD